MLRSALSAVWAALMRRSPIVPFKTGLVRRRGVWGAYNDGEGRGAFVALELRLPRRLAVGIRLPGERPMRLVTRLIQWAELSQNHVSPLEDLDDPMVDVMGNLDEHARAF